MDETEIPVLRLETRSLFSVDWLCVATVKPHEEWAVEYIPLIRQNSKKERNWAFNDIIISKWNEVHTPYYSNCKVHEPANYLYCLREFALAFILGLLITENILTENILTDMLYILYIISLKMLLLFTRAV